uniref:Uncharacterized protein n=1 Tax=Trypanosoma congolense (strain IL3000) TaxID=1068625 RepID=G0UP10_TRYCI|nr:conserved hypothetical protein [Trypanosoma congolense IL3000]
MLGLSTRTSGGSATGRSNDMRLPVEPFLEEHQAALALLAHAAVQTVTTRSSEFVFDVVCSSEPSLIRMYPEVMVLRGVHQVRRALRNLQECQPQMRSSLTKMVAEGLKDIYLILPDPLLLVISKTIEKTGASSSDCRTLEPHILDLVEYIQSVLLQETKLLRHRGKSLTLQLRETPPFVIGGPQHE